MRNKGLDVTNSGVSFLTNPAIASAGGRACFLRGARPCSGDAFGERLVRLLLVGPVGSRHRFMDDITSVLLTQWEDMSRD